MADRAINTQKLINDDKRYIWHPFTQMADWAKDDPSKALVIERGKGNYLYDTSGRKYIDGVSSLWVTVHGHNNTNINNAIKAQLSKIAHSTFLGLTHEPAIKLGKELVKIVPDGLTRVFYSDNGSTSVEIALKMAYQYWKHKGDKNRNSFLSLKNAYHGDTIGSVSVGGTDLFHKAFKNLLFKTYFAPSPYCFRCEHRVQSSEFGVRSKNLKHHCKLMGCSGQCIAGVESILKKHGKEIAGGIVEPMIQGASGMLTMPPGYMKEFEKIIKKYGILLICDEVATGFGRTGRMFACEHENIKPDLMCVAKGITGGYLPLAATFATEKIYKAFLGRYEEFKTFFHGHTYTANPLGCAAALANLEIFKDDKVLNKIQDKIKCLEKELQNLKYLEFVGDIRHIGLMAGIELIKSIDIGKGRNKGKNRIEDFEARDKIGAKVCAQCRNYGVLLRPLGNVIVLMPPLSITNNEIKKIVESIKNSVLKICKK
ncbi:MAG: adenosylmethionine--8-amino-7-oxononanoate transaminase [Elusimicrobia bacterium]|nr:adenosylmethionine--8-amino-7-oxononanoate transaminase [Candidatus Liberimonas magnetica]